jgi:hypothetical protein
VTFFGVQSITHTNIVSSTLDSHLHHQDWSGVARSLVSNRLAARRLTVGELAPIFDRRAVLIAKSLIILMTFPFTAVAALLFHRARKPFAAHAVFSLHLYAFLLLLFCGSLAVSGLDVWLGGAGLSSARWDNALSGVNLAVCALYLRAAIGVVYGTAGPLRLVQATVLAASVAGILLGYRFLVFVLTLYAV